MRAQRRQREARGARGGQAREGPGARRVRGIEGVPDVPQEGETALLRGFVSSAREFRASAGAGKWREREERARGWGERRPRAPRACTPASSAWRRSVSHAASTPPAATNASASEGLANPPRVAAGDMRLESAARMFCRRTEKFCPGVVDSAVSACASTCGARPGG